MIRDGKQGSLAWRAAAGLERLARRAAAREFGLARAEYGAPDFADGLVQLVGGMLDARSRLVPVQ